MRSSDITNTENTSDGFFGTGLSVTVPAGRLRGLGAIEPLPSLADEAWFRYHVKLNEWSSRSSGKLPGLSGLFSSSARGCKQSRPSAPGWSARGLFGAEGTRGAPDGEVPIGIYVYHLDQRRSCGEAVFWKDSSLEPGQWHCIEGHVRMNTPGLPDGQLTGWLDGTKRFSRSDLAFRRTNEVAVGIKELWMNVYYGGKRATPNELNLSIDEVEVSTDGRIGCRDSTTSAVASLGAGAANIANYEPSTGSWTIQRSTGERFSAEPGPLYSSSVGWETHLIADYTGDGIDEVASFHPSNGSWWVTELASTGSEPQPWASYTTRDGWADHLTGDYNGDGAADIASYHDDTGSWWVLISSGPGRVETAVEAAWVLRHLTVPASPSLIRRTLSTTSFQPNDAFTSERWETFSTTGRWRSQVVGDFNGDGKDDIANYHSGNGSWWVSVSGGRNFTTSRWAQFGTSKGWSENLVGDFNGDGLDDIANYHPATGTWWVNQSKGNSFTFSKWGEFTTHVGWDTQVVGDFNGDSRDDIASYHRAAGSWWVGLSAGSGFVIEKWAQFSPPTGWSSHLSDDFDGDGLDDLASFHEDSGTWWISLSTGKSFRPEAWSPAQGATTVQSSTDS